MHLPAKEQTPRTASKLQKLEKARKDPFLQRAHVSANILISDF